MSSEKNQKGGRRLGPALVWNLPEGSPSCSLLPPSFVVVRFLTLSCAGLPPCPSWGLQVEPCSLSFPAPPSACTRTENFCPASPQALLLPARGSAEKWQPAQEISYKVRGAALCKHNVSHMNEGIPLSGSNRELSFSQVQEESLLSLCREPTSCNDLKT